MLSHLSALGSVTRSLPPAQTYVLGCTVGVMLELGPFTDRVDMEFLVRCLTQTSAPEQSAGAGRGAGGFADHGLFTQSEPTGRFRFICSELAQITIAPAGILLLRHSSMRRKS